MGALFPVLDKPREVLVSGYRVPLVVDCGLHLVLGDCCSLLTAVGLTPRLGARGEDIRGYRSRGIGVDPRGVILRTHDGAGGSRGGGVGGVGDGDGGGIGDDVGGGSSGGCSGAAAADSAINHLHPEQCPRRRVTNV